MIVYCSWVDILNVLEWEWVFDKINILIILRNENSQNDHKQIEPYCIFMGIREWFIYSTSFKNLEILKFFQKYYIFQNFEKYYKIIEKSLIIIEEHCVSFSLNFINQHANKWVD